MAYFDIKTKRDLIKIKKRLQNRAFQESYKDYLQSYDIQKAYAPLINPMKEIVSKTDQSLQTLKAIETKDVPTIVYPQPALEQKQSEIPALENIPEETGIKLGRIATKYLSMRKDIDNVYGLKFPEEGSNMFKIGNVPVEVIGNDLIINNRLYRMNDNLWKLLMLKNPGKAENYNPADLEIYYKIMQVTTPFFRDKEKGDIIPSRAPKYGQIIKSIINQYNIDQYKKEIEPLKRVREEQQRRRSSSESDTLPQNSRKTGEGFNTVFLPSDINKLVQRHRLLLSALKAGNNGVFNEIQVINDVLLDRQILNTSDINKLNSLFSF